MRDVGKLWDIWDTSEGVFIGSNRAHGRVTVEKDWWLNLSPEVVGTSTRGPFRWFQRQDGTRNETEIPNIKSISIDRSIDQDAAECTIEIYNHWHETNSEPNELVNQFGKPGYFTWNRGESEESQARWNQAPNDWANVIVPNALLRTYQGYGGYDEDGVTPLPIEEALDAENIVLTGTWFVDQVEVGTNGMLVVKCRDAAKLLIEQPIFKPLVPSKLYPLDYHRWRYENIDTSWQPVPPVRVEVVKKGAVPLRYIGSTADNWYGPNASIHGHRATDALDGNPNTFCLSVGNSHPSRPFCADFWEYEVNAEINRVYIHPWAGNYTVYISIMENGAWVSNGEGTIHWSVSQLLGTQYVPPAVQNQNTDIPFVLREGVPWEEGRWYQLPRVFRAERLRITFRDHAQSPWGPYRYRCGMREIAAEVDFRDVEEQKRYPWTWGLTGHSSEGYRVVAAYGQQFAFGDARLLDKTDPWGINNYTIAATNKPDGTGYWTLDTNGRVHSYGTADWLGDPISDGASTDTEDWIDITSTHTGNGYWVLSRRGYIHSYGDAVWFGNPVSTPELEAAQVGAGDAWSYVATAIQAHPTDYGYWTVNGVGQVSAFGAAQHFGDVVEDPESPIHPQAWPRGIECTADGDGYWILYGDGHLFAFGNATWWGNAPLIPLTSELNTEFHGIWTDLELDHEGDGLVLLRADGTISVQGNATYYGKPGGTGQIRLDGNYKDYSDIIKELLLWAGFWLQSDPQPDGPYVHGNIESTGVYSDEPLDSDIFDKKPVIDAITTLKEIVGYLFWVDEEGAAHFESPNWWTPGNFFEGGERTSFIPEIDERLQLIDYGISFSDESLRSEIIISNLLTDKGDAGPIVSRVVPQGAELLRGMQRPAIWTNEVFINPDEQQIMAELIAMHIWFQQRIGQVTCVANPCIQINDQVRIWERNTSESFIHYVRGVSTNMDLDTGEYTMTLTTHWLGSDLDWVIQAG